MTVHLTPETTWAPPLPPSKSSNFALSFLFLGSAKRDAIRTIYGFCRVVDDIVDETGDPDTARARLATMRELVDRAYTHSPHESPLGTKLAETVARYPIQRVWFHQLIRGMEMDLEQSRYATFENLKTYCYRVASVVGMICIEVFGYRNRLARAYAETLGLALQLTNIVRDVGDDADRGRIYLPLDELSRFGYAEDDLLRRVHDDRFVALMTFQAARARDFLNRARALRPHRDRRSLIPAEIMGETYGQLLQKVEQTGFPVLTERVSVPKWSKAARALRVSLRNLLLP